MDHRFHIKNSKIEILILFKLRELDALEEADETRNCIKKSKFHPLKNFTLKLIRLENITLK